MEVGRFADKVQSPRVNGLYTYVNVFSRQETFIRNGLHQTSFTSFVLSDLVTCVPSPSTKNTATLVNVHLAKNAVSQDIF